MRYIQNIVLWIKEKEHEWDVKIFPLWVRRTNQNLMVADNGSKPVDKDEWQVSLEDYNMCMKKMGVSPTVDGMAVKSNARCDVFFSRLPELDSAGVDFFWQPLLSTEIYFLCPPIKLIQRVINKVLAAKGITVVLLIPHWRSHPFYTALRDKQAFKSCIVKHFTFNALFESSVPQCMFMGRKAFNMICLLIKT